MKSQRFFLLSCLFLALLALPKKGAAKESPSTTSLNVQGYQIVQLMRGRQNHMLLEATVLGKRLTFIVDSGATRSAISGEAADRLRLAAPDASMNLPTQTGVNGNIKRVVWLPELVSGNMNLGPGPMAVVGDEGLANVYRRNINSRVDGIIGCDILKHYQAILNCRTAQIFFKRDPHASKDFTATLQKAGYRSTQLRQEGGLLYLNCQFRGQKSVMAVDTGAFVTLLQRNVLKAAKVPMAGTDRLVLDVDEKRSQLHIVEAADHQIIIAGIPVRGPVGATVVPQIDSGALGLLGCDVLGLQAAIIDFDKMLFYFHEPIAKGK